MKNENVQEQIDSVNSKLDLILDEIEHQKRHRKEMEDLKDDLMRVGTGIYQTAITELEELHDHTSGDDLLFLGKKLLRNINNITQTFELLENAKGFLQDFSPVSRELIFDAMEKFDEFDRKGYFEFIKELEKVADKVVTSFSVEDIKALSENIVTILNTIKNLTQPDMLKALNNAVLVYNKLDINIEDDISYLKLIKELKTPEMKKGLAFGIKYLKSLSEEKSINHNN
jgi:uncharacterized protein YjgD (DUF1641 family)